MELIGKYNSAKVFTNNIDEKAISQVQELCDQEFVKDAKIRIMPDVHAGAGCTIGTTMTITDKVVPNLVGVDIGCGMLWVNLGKINLDLPEIDKYIRLNIPHGFGTNKNLQYNYISEINKVYCLSDLLKTSEEFNLALGSLGGGNHFIEINKNEEGNQFLVIHSGSRNMGLRIANNYQDKANEYLNGVDEEYNKEKELLVKEYREAGKEKQIQNGLDVLKKKHKKISNIKKELCYLENDLMDNYLHDLKIAQIYAEINRETMAKKILNKIGLDLKYCDYFHTIHNYIDLDNMILRKGAVSAQQGQRLIIPINMHDGSLLCVGKGNSDWNYSAPHGAGRLMSRTEAKEKLSIAEYKNTMSEIYTTSVSDSTLDEAPMAYKPMQEIIDNIQDTVEVVEIIKPIYNFKAA